MKRLLALLVTTIMLGTLSVACGSSKATLVQASATTCYKTGWAMYGGNASHNRNAACAARFNGALHRQWSVDMGGVLEMPPSASHGVLYTAQDNGRVSAVVAATGEIKWMRNFKTMFTDSPAVWHNGGLLFVESRYHGSYPTRGLLAIDIQTGKLVWKTTTWGAGEAAPVIVGTPSGVRVYAVNSQGWMGAWVAKTGRQVWRRWIGPANYPHPVGPTLSLNSSAATTAPDDPLIGLATPAEQAATCYHPPPHTGGGGGGTVIFGLKYTDSPAYHNGVFYMASYAGAVWAINWKGHVVWHRNVPGSSVYASPAYAHGHLFFASRDGTTYSLNAGNGSLRWRTPTGFLTYGAPAVSNGAVYTADYGGSYWKLNGATGKVLWRYNTGIRENTSPVVVGERVFFGEHGACSSQHGRIFGFNTNTMRKVFVFPDGRYSPTVVSGNILVMVGFGHMYGLVHTGATAPPPPPRPQDPASGQ